MTDVNILTKDIENSDAHIVYHSDRGTYECIECEVDDEPFTVRDDEEMYFSGLHFHVRKHDTPDGFLACMKQNPPFWLDIETLEYGRNKVGEFKIDSGEVWVADPCHKRDSSSIEKIKAKNGNWEFFIYYHKGDVWSAVVIHKDIEDKNFESGTFKGFQNAIDTAQWGVFDSEYYQKHEKYDWESQQHICQYKRPDLMIHQVEEPMQISKNVYEDGKPVEVERIPSDFYSVCCSNSYPASIIDHGCVTTTGVGDGNYQVIYLENQKGEAIGFMSDFYYISEYSWLRDYVS